MLLLAACAVVLAEPAAPVPAPGLRLDGTIVQYQPWMLRLTRRQWAGELDAMRRAGMRVVVVRWLRHGRQSYIPATRSQLDLTGELLRYADRHGWQVYIGLYADEDWRRGPRDRALLDRTAAASLQVASSAWRRYGSHRSFRGWHVPQETWGEPFDPAQIDLHRAFLRRVSDGCKRLSGPLPVSAATFYTTTTPPDAVRDAYARMLDGAGVDTLLVQDGIGVQGWDNRIEDVAPAYLAAFRDACLAAGVEVWAVIENFRRRPGSASGFMPAPGPRVLRQLAAAAPFTRRRMTFDFVNYMSPARGPEQRRLFEHYVREAVRKPWRPILGPSVQVDPVFGYYRDRSPESVAAEIRAAGYPVVRYVVTADSNVDGALISAFHREGIGVWYTTFANGSYTTTDLPPGWERWRMVTRTDLTTGRPPADGYHRLCLNNAEYRAWKKRQIAAVARAHPFDGIEVLEPHWPEYPGPSGPTYACFCEACVAAFRELHPEEPGLPDIVDPESPRAPGRSPSLWRKWLDFRRRTHTGFLHDLVNGPGGIRQTAPGRPVSVWTLALERTDGVRTVLEVHGQDAGEVARTVRPDVYGLQTHWPDWIRADLSPDYPARYRPFVDQVLGAVPGMQVLIQADTGSQKQNRRDWAWIRTFERTSREVGALSTTIYEYFIGDYIYLDPPRVVEVEAGRDTIVLRFSKRVEAATAGDPARYALSAGRVESARVDGSMVHLAVSGVPVRRVVALTVRGVRDDAARRLFDDRPHRVLEEQTVRFCIGARDGAGGSR
ncbi:MAG TPA: DUF4434 domain-containing protein [Chthonomonadales bacterium]|nr:DUF4434 domain-containing protein [Chthonomonadales bacterium]